jgi:RNA polymerase sigma-70 factor, ECF subfamily
MSSFFSSARLFALPTSSDEADLTTAHPLYKDAPAEQISDESLIPQILSGNQEALAVLFRRYAGLVHGIGRRVLRDNAEAEDLVQDLFVYIHLKASLYDPVRGSVRTWILQTSYYKALIRRTQLMSQQYYGCVDFEGQEAEKLADLSLPPYERSGEGLFGRDRWRELVSCLTERQWETFRLHFFEGYTFGEIAIKRNESIGNVRHHFYRGLDRMRKYLFDVELRES